MTRLKRLLWAFLLSAPFVAADSNAPVSVALKVHVDGKTTVSSTYNHTNSTTITSRQGSDEFTWSADLQKTWSATWITGSINMLITGQGQVPLDTISVDGNGAASEYVYQDGVVGCSTGDRPQISQSQASWQYAQMPDSVFGFLTQDITNIFFGLATSSGYPMTYSIGLDPGFAFLMPQVTGAGTETYNRDCNPTETDAWITWDAYAQAGDFGKRHWQSVQQDPKFQALLNGTLTSATTSQTATFTFNDDQSVTEGGTSSTTIVVTLSLEIGPFPPPPPQVKPDDCRCQNQGSIIGAQDQSLGQAVKITGTPFTLRYQSDRMPGALGATAPWTANSLALGGWSLNVQHAYDSSSGVLYLGTGERRSGASVQTVAQTGGGFLIPGQENNLVYEFDASGRHARTLNQLTGLPRYTLQYDSEGRLTGIQDDYGNLTTIERSGASPTAIDGPYGQKTTLTADANGYLSRITAPDGAVTAATYDQTGLMQTFTDPRGNVHQFTFDSNGLLTQDTEPDGTFQSLIRIGSGNGYQVADTTADGWTTLYTVTNPTTNPVFQTTFPDGASASGNKDGAFFGDTTSATGMLSHVDYGADSRWGSQAALPSGFQTSTPGGLASSGAVSRTVQLNDPSNPLSVADLLDTMTVNGQTYQSEFSSASSTITDTTPLGRQVILTLNAQGHPAVWQKNGLAAFHFIYDSHGRLSTLTQGEGDQQRTAAFEYGSDGLLSRYTDAMGHVQSYTRDKAGRITSLTLPDQSVVGMTYDLDGNLTVLTTPAGKTHAFAYNTVDRLSSYVAPVIAGESMPETFVPNGEGQPWLTVRPDGGLVERNYDGLARVESVTYPNGQLSYSYDSKTGQVTDISDAGGNSLAYSYDGDLLLSSQWSGAVIGQVRQSYNTDFRVTSVTVNNADPVNLTYDADGWVSTAGAIAITRDPLTALVTGVALDGVLDTSAYDAFGELSQYTVSGPAGPIYGVTYSRDPLGRITDRSETIGASSTAWHYTYDAAGRLTGADKDGSAFARYTYDPNGNRTQAITGGSTVSPVSDNAVFDNQDRLLTSGSAAYTFAAGGELSTKNIAGAMTTYQYDALGNLLHVALPGGPDVRYTVDGALRRVGKSVNGTLARAFLYLDRTRIAAELDAAGNLVSQFVYGDGPVPLYMIKGGVNYRILTDSLDSPRLVVNSITGDVAQEIDYDPFGKVILDSNPGFQPFGFAGGLYDPDTGLVRFGFRDYDAGAGRWTVKDPALFAGGDTNLYVYAGNDPVNRTDRQGMDGDGGEAAAASAAFDSAVDQHLSALLQQAIAQAKAALDDNDVLAPLVPPDEPLAPLVPPDEPLAPLVPPDEPLAPLVPNPAKQGPCGKRLIWVKKGDEPWMPWWVTPTSAWPANPMGPD